MFHSLQQPLFKWLIAFIGSLFLHILFGYYYFFKAEIPISELTASAVIVEFSDPPQSIFMPTELPVGPPQQVSVESMPEAESPKDEMFENNTDLILEETTPSEVKPEIIVQKKQKNIESNNKEVREKIRKKPSIKEKDLVENSKNIKKNVKKVPSDKPSPAGSNVATAPLVGTSNRIAAEFNSVSQGQNSELNWRSLVKAHLQRNLRYPEQALKKRWKGVAIINIILDSQSNVVSVKLLKSSGKDSFDREAIENAKRSSPLPKLPHHFSASSQVSLDVPVNFDYDRYRK